MIYNSVENRAPQKASLLLLNKKGTHNESQKTDNQQKHLDSDSTKTFRDLKTPIE